MGTAYNAQDTAGCEHICLQRRFGPSSLVLFCKKLLFCPMSSIPELEAQKASNKKRLADIRDEIRNAGKRARRQQTHKPLARILYDAGIQGSFPCVSAQQQKGLVMLFELADFCPDVVVSYALGQGREDRHKCTEFDQWDPEVRQAISAAVYILYNNMDFDHAVYALDGSEYSLKTLSRYVVEYRVFHWVVEQNCEKGVSPTPRLVCEAASRYVPTAAPQLLRQGMRGFFLSSHRAARYWLVSFKKRWQGQSGSLGTGEDLEPGVLEQKAFWPSLVSEKKRRKSCSYQFPTFKSISWHQKGVPKQDPRGSFLGVEKGH